MTTGIKPCPECGQKNLFRTTTNSGSSDGPRLLPDLGGFFASAKFDVVVCADCGLTRLFASKEACAKLTTSDRWSPL